MKALVTGGGGFLGSAIINILVKRGDTVCSLSRNEYPKLNEIGVRQFKGDLTDSESVKTASEGCDVIFHVAAKAGIWGPYKEYYRINVEGTRNVINACRLHNIPKLVFSSSASVVFTGADQEYIDETAPYPKKYLTHYSATKAMAEREVLAANGSHPATVALRPHLIWGPGDNHLIPRLLDRVRSGKLRKIGHGKKLVDSIYIDNAAEAHVLAADRLSSSSQISGHVYFISQDEPISMDDLLDRITLAGGLTPVNKYIPGSVAYIAGAFLELTYKILKRKEEPKMTRFLARQLSATHCFSIDAAKRDLGYTPSVSFNEGLSRLSKSLGVTKQ
ncbi:MAG: NAD-dependent epimerase/dehydratase family protein [Candidatus Anammoxibacter sp.]